MHFQGVPAGLGEEFVVKDVDFIVCLECGMGYGLGLPGGIPRIVAGFPKSSERPAGFGTFWSRIAVELLQPVLPY